MKPNDAKSRITPEQTLCIYAEGSGINQPDRMQKVIDHVHDAAYADFRAANLRMAEMEDNLIAISNALFPGQYCATLGQILDRIKMIEEDCAAARADSDALKIKNKELAQEINRLVKERDDALTANSPQEKQRIPFDLEKAKAGEPIETRDGNPARFIAFVPEAEIGSKIVFICENGEWKLLAGASHTSTGKGNEAGFLRWRNQIVYSNLRHFNTPGRRGCYGHGKILSRNFGRKRRKRESLFRQGKLNKTIN